MALQTEEDALVARYEALVEAEKRRTTRRARRRAAARAARKARTGRAAAAASTGTRAAAAAAAANGGHGKGAGHNDRGILRMRYDAATGAATLVEPPPPKGPYYGLPGAVAAAGSAAYVCGRCGRRGHNRRSCQRQGILQKFGGSGNGNVTGAIGGRVGANCHPRRRASGFAGAVAYAHQLQQRQKFGGSGGNGNVSDTDLVPIKAEPGVAIADDAGVADAFDEAFYGTKGVRTKKSGGKRSASAMAPDSIWAYPGALPVGDGGGASAPRAARAPPVPPMPSASSAKRHKPTEHLAHDPEDPARVCCPVCGQWFVSIGRSAFHSYGPGFHSRVLLLCISMTGSIGRGLAPTGMYIIWV